MQRKADVLALLRGLLGKGGALGHDEEWFREPRNFAAANQLVSHVAQ